MARAESITFEKFRTRFSAEDACRTELFRLRFPNGFVCPKCGCTELLPGSRTEHVPVPRLPAPDLRHRWNRYAPHAPAADGLVLDDLSLCHVQTRHFCRSAESYVEHLL